MGNVTRARLHHNSNKKQCSRQLQCEVPCGVGNVINSSLFIKTSLSSLPSTSHAACCPWKGGSGQGGQGTFQSSCHVLHYHMVLRPKGTSHNKPAEGCRPRRLQSGLTLPQSRVATGSSQLTMDQHFRRDSEGSRPLESASGVSGTYVPFRVHTSDPH